MNRILIVLIASSMLMLTGCCDQPLVEKNTDQLLEVDRQFSKLSEEKGAAYAFEFYMADTATMLRDGYWPITNKDEILAPLKNIPKDAKLIWEPDMVDIAASNDLGYTIGTWTFTMPDSTGAITTSKGNYVTIWKLMPDSKWRYVFDTGTDGPEEGK